MSSMNKFVNVVVWIALVLLSFGAASKAYMDWVMHTHIHSILILIILFALIFWAFFKILNMLEIWNNGEGRE